MLKKYIKKNYANYSNTFFFLLNPNCKLVLDVYLYSIQVLLISFQDSFPYTKISQK